MSVRIFFFFSFNSPKDSLFHSFSFDLTNYSFFMNLWPFYPLTWYSLHRNLKLALKLGWNNHILSNLNAVSPYLNGLVSWMIGQWSKINLGRASWRLWRNLCSHSFGYKNISKLLRIGNSCIFDQVKDAFLRGGSINSLSFMNSSKSLMLGVIMDTHNFHTFFLWH